MVTREIIYRLLVGKQGDRLRHIAVMGGYTPHILQFQKQMRLQEARRLMLGEGLDAASAGSRVGYNDAAYFNREYKRLFGVPPIRDVVQLRQAAGKSAELGAD